MSPTEAFIGVAVFVYFAIPCLLILGGALRNAADAQEEFGGLILWPLVLFVWAAVGVYRAAKQLWKEALRG